MMCIQHIWFAHSSVDGHLSPPLGNYDLGCKSLGVECLPGRWLFDARRSQSISWYLLIRMDLNGELMMPQTERNFPGDTGVTEL